MSFLISWHQKPANLWIYNVYTLTKRSILVKQEIIKYFQFIKKDSSSFFLIRQSPIPVHYLKRDFSLYMSLSLSLYACLSLFLSVSGCLSLYLAVSLCLSVSLCIYFSLYLSLSLSIYLSLSLSLSLSLRVSLSLSLSISQQFF